MYGHQHFFSINFLRLRVPLHSFLQLPAFLQTFSLELLCPGKSTSS